MGKGVVNVGVIGAGVISEVYLRNLQTVFRGVRVTAICDLAKPKAETAAERYGICHVYDNPERLMEDEDVQVVLNLTRPADHFALTRLALMRGKHVYSEKPLALTLEEGRELVSLAQEKKLYLGCAPDTFLGAGLQTAKRLIDEGWIGKPVGAACAMLSPGHEKWHPAPDFFYGPGGGPVMDMGPYYITALVSLLGGVSSVSAMTGRGSDARIIESAPRFGETIPVLTDTHCCGLLRFRSGAVANVTFSFDVQCDPRNQSGFAVYGTKGTLLVPDPNTFGGSVQLYRPEDQPKALAVDPGSLENARHPIGFREIPLRCGYAVNARGLGLAQMCAAIREGTPVMASGEMQLHVLEVLLALSGGEGQCVHSNITSLSPSVSAMREDLPEGVL